MLAAILLCISLGLDTLAVCLALGMAGLPRSRWWRVGLSFSLCEGGAPLVGMALGSLVSGRLASWGAIFAGALLLTLGLLRIVSALRKRSESDVAEAMKQTHGWRLIVLGLSVSVDNLAIGFSLGALVTRQVQLAMLVVIPLQCLLLTGIGLAIGSRIGHALGRSASWAAGLILVVIGVVLIAQRLTGHTGAG